MTGSNSVKMLTAIRAALMKNPEGRAHEIADRIEHREAGLFAAWAQDLAREKLRSLVLAECRPRREDEPYQMFFPGFQRLSARLPLKEGFVELRRATITNLRESLKVIESRDQKKRHPRRDAIQNLIKEMEPYSRASCGLEFERFCEMRAAGVPRPPASLTREQRSMISRANWASMTAQQRSAIAAARWDAKKAAQKAEKDRP